MPAKATYYDTVFNGLVPVKFLRRALPTSESSTLSEVVVKVLKDTGPYKAGEELVIWAYHFVEISRRTKCNTWVTTAPIPTTEEGS